MIAKTGIMSTAGLTIVILVVIWLIFMILWSSKE